MTILDSTYGLGLMESPWFVWGD